MARLTRKKSVVAPPEFLVKARAIAEMAADHKAIDIRVYDVRGLTVIADAFLLCSAASEPQLRAIFNAVRSGMKEAGAPPFHAEGGFKGGWLVIDYGDVIVHVFREEAREFYDLDGLWADAPQVELELAP